MTEQEKTKETESADQKEIKEEKKDIEEGVSDNIENLKDEIAESYLLSLDAKKEGLVGTIAGFGIAINPLHKRAKEYLLDKSAFLDKKQKKVFNKLKKILLEKIDAQQGNIPKELGEIYSIAYDKTTLDKMKELLTQHKNDKAMLESIKQQIEEGKDPLENNSKSTEEKSIPEENKDPVENQSSKKIDGIDINNDLKQKIESELQNYAFCPLTATMILDSATKHKVPVEYIMAIMRNDSHYGTQGIGAKTHNPGNVGNTDDGSTKDRATREAGVDAVAENLARRIKEYQKIYGDKTPSLEELSNNQGPDKKGFLSNQGNYKQYNQERMGAYMTDKRGGNNVQKISNELAQNFSSNKEEKLVA